jgi:hypothetical protein
MKSSQWYRRNYGVIVLSGILFATFVFAHVDLIDPGLIVEHVKETMEKEAKENGESWTDENGVHHNV